MSDAATHVGDLRPSQLLWTFGVGAVLDLPQLSAIVLGIDDWPEEQMAKISEERLLAAVRAALGNQVAALRSPPVTRDEVNPFEDEARIGVPVAPFPRWLRCPRCRLIASLESGLFELEESPWRPDRVRYIHRCGTRRPATALAVRFLVACRAGHHDDFPWIEYVHGRRQGGVCERPQLQLNEMGVGGEAAQIEVRCTNCDSRRRMSEAFGPEAEGRLPRCRGRHPHLGIAPGDCQEKLRTILLGASNAWFAANIGVLSVPSHGDALAQLVEDRWAALEPMASKEVLEYGLGQNPELAKLKEFEVEEVWAAIVDRRDGTGAPEPAGEDLLRPEWEVFASPGDAPETEDFKLSTREPPRPFGDSIAEVVLCERLREVVALTGFTRIDAPDDSDPDGSRTPRAPISRTAPSWVPCTEVRGEGIFLGFHEERLKDWERRYRESERMDVLASAHARWRQRRNLDPAEGLREPRFVLLHTLAHALIRELALECGYGAASIRERIYASTEEGPPMAGLLLYTAAPDSEGTLGGLVALGEPDALGRILGQALERARLCSSDPLCSEHDPRDDGSVHGAACHACQFASETSCVLGNRFLDRATITDTFSTTDLSFFS